MWALVAWLPFDSPLARSMDPEGVGRGWNPTNDLLAYIAEISDVTNVILMRVYSEKGAAVRDPVRIPRPGASDKTSAPVVTGPALENWVEEYGGKVVSKKKAKKNDH